MKLYHHECLLGGISDSSPEGTWMIGTIILSPEAETYLPFFEFMTDESKGSKAPPFGEDLLDPQQWFIEEGGQMRGIEVPAVHGDGTIEWRWR